MVPKNYFPLAAVPKGLLPLWTLALLLGCSPSGTVPDYYGQAQPGNAPKVFAAGDLSEKGRWEHGISFSPDTQEMVFGVLHSDGSGTVYHAQKQDGQWARPEIFGPLKGKSTFLPYFAPQGKTLLYAQSRSDSLYHLTDIWSLSKNGDIWGQPQKLDTAINSPEREAQACMTLNQAVYFSSNRKGRGQADLYFSAKEQGSYATAQRLEVLSSGADEESLFVDPHGRYIIFSRYATLENGPDLFISYHNARGNWTLPEALNAAINTPHWERRPYVTPDRSLLFYTQMIFDEQGLLESDIYWANTQKVFKPFVYRPFPEITVRVNEEATLPVPADYFKDMDSERLKIDLNNDTLDWIHFDEEKRKLTLQPHKTGAYKLHFTATDAHGNKTEDTVSVNVKSD